MKFYPYKFQNEAIEFIIHNKMCALMLDIDMGKIVVALTAINILKYDCFDVNKVLIVTSKRVIQSWVKEKEKWEHLNNINMSVVVGNDRQKKQALNNNSDVYITNIESVQWLFDNNHFTFDMVVIDGLSNYKNNKSKRFITMLNVKKSVKRLIGLTYMPAPNGLDDLWAQMYLIDEGKRLGKYKTGFYERYFWIDRVWYGMEFRYKRVLKEGAEEAIYKAISDVCMTVKKEEYFDLPKVLYQNIYVFMSGSEYSRYKFMEYDMIMQTEKDTKIRVNNTVALASKLLQMANGMVYDNKKDVHRIHVKKLDALEQLIKDSDNKNILVVYWFNHDKFSLQERFDNARVIENAKDIDEWNNGKIKLGLMNPATGGENIDMHYGGSILIWYSLTWSLQLYEQMNNRIINRISSKYITIMHLIMKDTIDEKIIKILEKKNNNQNELLNAIYELQENCV